MINGAMGRYQLMHFNDVAWGNETPAGISTHRPDDEDASSKRSHLVSRCQMGHWQRPGRSFLPSSAHLTSQPTESHQQSLSSTRSKKAMKLQQKGQMGKHFHRSRDIKQTNLRLHISGCGSRSMDGSSLHIIDNKNCLRYKNLIYHI